MSQSTQIHEFTVYEKGESKPKAIERRKLGIRVDGMKPLELGWTDDEASDWGPCKGFAYSAKDGKSIELVVGIAVNRGAKVRRRSFTSRSELIFVWMHL